MNIIGLVKYKFCTEEIQEDTIICKHCKSNLKDDQTIQNSKVLSNIEKSNNECLFNPWSVRSDDYD